MGMYKEDPVLPEVVMVMYNAELPLGAVIMEMYKEDRQQQEEVQIMEMYREGVRLQEEVIQVEVSEVLAVLLK